MIKLLWFVLPWAFVVMARQRPVAPRHCGGGIRHVHLAVGPDPSTSMIVSFATIPSRFKPFPVAGVRIGTRADQLNVIYLEEENSPRFYNITTTKLNWGNDGATSTYWSPYYHHVIVKDLKPSTTYYYQPIVQASPAAFETAYGNYMTKEQRQALEDRASSLLDRSDGKNWQRKLIRWGPYDGSDRECPSPNKIRSFSTAPSASYQASFAIMGDLGQFPHSEQTMSRLLRSKNELDAAVLAGDVAYTSTDHREWDTFFDFLDDYMAFETIPLQLCPGNHDIDKYASSNEIFLAFQNRFRMPELEPAQLGVYDGPAGPLNLDKPPYPLPYEYGNSYYSWKYAGAHFVMVNAYASVEPGSKQRRFINMELKSVKRDVTPWLIVVMHVPLYNTFGLHLKDPQIAAAKKNLEPLFVENNVNIVFSGHIHAYSRTQPVSMDRLDPKGPVYITVGAGGRNCEAPFLHREQEDWVVVRDATMYGYGMLRIHNETTAEWDWIQTSPTDNDRDYNQLKGSEEHLAPGPSVDHVYITNQYFR